MLTNASDYLFSIWQVKQQQKYPLCHSCCLDPGTKGPADVPPVSGSLSWDFYERLTGVKDHGVISFCIHLLGTGLHKILYLTLQAVNWSLPINSIEKNQSGEDSGCINITVFPCSMTHIVPALFSGISSKQKIRSKKRNWDFPGVLLTLENEDGIIASGPGFH